MNKVWLAAYDSECHSDNLIGVFSTKEKAIEYLKLYIQCIPCRDKECKYGVAVKSEHASTRCFTINSDECFIYHLFYTISSHKVV